MVFADTFDPSSLSLGAIESPDDPRTLKLTDYLVPAELPTRPDRYSNATTVNPWDMLGNDNNGDCVVAGYAHLQMALSILAGMGYRPTAAEVVALYYQLTGGADVGLVILNFIKYLRKNVVFGRKLLGFAAITPGDLEVTQIATYLFKGVMRGILLPNSAVAQTGPTKRWVPRQNLDDPDNRPGSWGGHLTCDIGYTPDTLETVTWGFVQAVDPAFYRTYSMESYALIPTYPIPGFDYAKFVADLRSIGTNVDADPVPDPPPPPEPTPTPPPAPGETDYQALQRILGAVTSIEHVTKVGGEGADIVRFSKSPPWYFPTKG